MATQKVSHLAQLAAFELDKTNIGGQGVPTFRQHTAGLVSAFRDVAALLRLTSKLRPGQYLIYTPENSNQGIIIKKEEVPRYISAFVSILESEELFLEASVVNWSRFKGVPGQRSRRLHNGLITLEPIGDKRTAFNLVYGRLLEFYREVSAIMKASTGRGFSFLDKIYRIDAIRTAVTNQLNANINDLKQLAQNRRECAGALQTITDMLTSRKINEQTEFVLVSTRVHQMIVSMYNATLTQQVVRADFKPMSKTASDKGHIHLLLKVNRVINLNMLFNNQPNLITKYFADEIAELATTRNSGLDEKPYTPYIKRASGAAKAAKIKLRFNPERAQHTDTISIVNLSKNSLSSAGSIVVKAFMDSRDNNDLISNVASTQMDADVKLLLTKSSGANKTKNIFEVIGTNGQSYYGALRGNIGEFQLFAQETLGNGANQFIENAIIELKKLFTSQLGYQDGGSANSVPFFNNVQQELRNLDNMQLGLANRQERIRKAQLRQARK